MSGGDGFDESDNHKNDEESEIDFEGQWTRRSYGWYGEGCRLMTILKRN
jgi:hypothetical protein